jgi:HTH-type transcriptional regulator / antitoxin HigA
MEAMSANPVNPAYSKLLARVGPKVIRTEQENEHFIEALRALDERAGRLSKEEKELAELLSLLIEEFEERHYALPKATPVEVLQFLMEQNNLRQKDLLDIFKTRSIASEVISGKRDLTKEHIRMLSERFRISPEVFF